jgi:phosphoribosylformimino-5-aminoimidazole carboxamide ribotide isomerase
VVIVPSIDVRAGRLGDGSELAVATRAHDLVADGAEELHLVDLDGAETGLFLNLELLADVAGEVGVPCRLAGGVSRVEDARSAIDRGFAGVLF